MSTPDETTAGAGTPFSSVGAGDFCRACGAGPHPTLPGRCASGHLVRGNGVALVAGQTSLSFWQAHEDARQGIRAAIIADAGHTSENAPEALRLAADSVAMAALVQQSAFARVVEAGGPMTAHGRSRRAFAIWVQASDRLERYLRLVGLRRLPRPVPSLAEALAAVETEGEE